MITQAFVLGAGLGTRLRPLTEDLPKPLIPIFQKPLITFALDHLLSAGVQSFIINTHHRPTHFIEFFGRDAAPPWRGQQSNEVETEGLAESGIGVDPAGPRQGGAASLQKKSLPENPVQGFYRNHPLILQYEPILLGTGGGIKNVEGFLDTEPFIVYSGDLLTDFALEPLVKEHVRKGNDVTLALRKTGLATDVALKGGRIVDIENRHGHPGEYDFANVSVWNRSIFQRIPPGQSVSFIPIVAEWISQGGKIGGIAVEDGQWFNIGSRTEYLAVHRFINERGWKPSYVTTTEWPMRVAADAVIDSSAKFSGFYSIGARCQVGGLAMLENSILWPGAQIASRTRLINCIVRTDQRVKGEHHDRDI